MFWSRPRISVRMVATVAAFAVVAPASVAGASVAGASKASPPVRVPVVTVSDPTLEADQLSVAAIDFAFEGQRGLATASWRTFDGQNWRIAVATDLGSGAWTAPLFISPAGVDAEHPSAGVALSSNYGSIGVYQQVAWRLVTGEVQVARKTESATSWSQPVTVSAAGADTSAPISAVSDDSDELYTYAAVAWLARDKSHWRAHYLSFDPEQQPDPTRVKLVSPVGHDAADLSVSASYGIDDLAWVLHVGDHWQPQWWDSYYPHLASAPTGETEDAATPVAGWYGLVWTSAIDGHMRLRASLNIDDPRVPLPTPVSVSAPGVDVSDVHLVPSDGDSVQVVWLEDDGSSVRVATSWGDPETNRWQPAAYLSPSSAQAAELSTDALGSAVWTETVSDENPVVMLAKWRQSAWSTPIAVTADYPAVSTPTPIDIGWGTKVTVGVVWVAPTADGAAVEVAGYDVTAPNTLVELHGEGWRNSTVRLFWRSVDDWSPLASVQVRTKSAGITDPHWTTTVRSLTAATGSEETPLREGTSYCFDVRGVDTVGHLERWHGRGFLNFLMCTCTPTDDRDLTRSPGWRRVEGARYLNGSALSSRRTGSTVSLRLVRSTGQRLLVEKGPRAGRIRFAFGGQHRYLSLRAHTHRVAWVEPFLGPIGVSPETGTLKVTVVSHGRTVRIDGVLSKRY